MAPQKEPGFQKHRDMGSPQYTDQPPLSGPEWSVLSRAQKDVCHACPLLDMLLSRGMPVLPSTALLVASLWSFSERTPNAEDLHPSLLPEAALPGEGPVTYSAQVWKR